VQDLVFGISRAICSFLYSRIQKTAEHTLAEIMTDKSTHIVISGMNITHMKIEKLMANPRPVKQQIYFFF